MNNEIENLDFLETLSEKERDSFYKNRKTELQKKYELKRILKWFDETDYIELQASRGTISRDSQKYLDYITEYNIKLNRYKELTNS